MQWRLRSAAVLAFGLILLAIGGGCRCTRTPPSSAGKSPVPSVRLYLFSTLAGAAEPCGCVKDMLGGVDHFAALLANEASAAPGRLVLGAGPALFMDPALDPKRAAQDLLKARAIGDILAGAKVAGWAPGANDWAGGGEVLREIAGSRLALFAANVEGQPFAGARVFDVGGERVGVAGVSAPAFRGAAPEGARVGDPRAALERAAKELEHEGARIRVALVALPRGEALRLADALPSFQLFLIGKPADQGETNDLPTPPVLIGDTLIVETPNHLQSVAVVDFFVRDGRYTFADGSGIAEEERRTSLKQRIADLEAVLAQPSGAEQDRQARRRDLEALKTELGTLSASRPPPPTSSFSYRLVEVREKLGKNPTAAGRLASYYRGVNEHNREAFKGVLPEPAPPGGSGYVGMAQCSTCHQSERRFWDKTPHAGAYVSLSRQEKQFNLECVGCHVTGYEAPGGSTVAHVAGLENVQCEVCHGPGSRHVGNPADKTLISSPERTLCAAKCHHPPHVNTGWNVQPAWKVIVGPGHGG